MADIARMVVIAQELAVVAHRLMKVRTHQNCRGGNLVVINHRQGVEKIHAQIGQVASAEEKKCHYLALEQAWRLYQNKKHTTSHESRNPESLVPVCDPRMSEIKIYFENWGRWGGAVRGDTYVFSFAGFHEEIDEAMMFALAVKLRDLNKDWVVSNFAGSNQLLKPFFDECHWTE